jgi:uncharacterized protein
MFQARCPICERSLSGSSAAEFPHLPFCSERCRRIDMGRWLGESYRIPDDDSGDSLENVDDGDSD